MILTRNITRSFDMYHEVEITDELLDDICDYLGEEIDLEHLSHLDDYSDVWTAIDDLHWNNGDIIFQEEQRFPDQNYDDVVHYGLTDKSALIEPEAI